MWNGLRKPFRIFIFCLSIAFFANPSLSQTRVIDSMRRHIKDEGADTSKVITMKWLSFTFYKREAYDSAKKYSFLALQLCDTLKYKRGMTGCYENIGFIAFD